LDGFLKAGEMKARRISFRFESLLVVALTLAGARSGTTRMLLVASVILESFLIRELLRALAGVACGRRATVILMALSSNTELEPELSRRHLALFQLAGPLLNFLFAAGLHWACPNPASSWVVFAVKFNMAWGLISLLPVLPFDGGRVLDACLGADRAAATMLVSVGVAEVSTTAAIVAFRSPELGLLFLTAGVYSALRWHRARCRWLDSHVLARLELARGLLETKRYDEARSIAEEAVQTACSPAARNAALAVLARAAIQIGQPRTAASAIRQISPRSAVDAWTLATVESANGDVQRAIATLNRARRAGDLDRAGARLLIDLQAAGGDLRSVATTAAELARLLGPDDLRLVIGALQVAGETDLAAHLVPALTSPLAIGCDVEPGHGPQPPRPREGRTRYSS
jgi:Zn-dependent protease